MGKRMSQDRVFNDQLVRKWSKNELDTTASECWSRSSYFHITRRHEDSGRNSNRLHAYTEAFHVIKGSSDTTTANG